MIRKYMPVIMVYPSHKKSYENALFKRHILPVYKTEMALLALYYQI